MSRIRGVKPELFRHEELQELGERAILVFIGLLTQADREGRFRWQPRQLKLDILPFLGFDMVSVLDALASRGFIARYEVGGKSYGLITGFTKHQYTTGREPDSKLPAPPSDLGISKLRKGHSSHASVTDSTIQSHVPGIDSYMPDTCQEMFGHTGSELESESEKESNIAALTSEPETPSELLLEAPTAPEKPAKARKAAIAKVSDAIVDGIYSAYPLHEKPGKAKVEIRAAIARIAKADGISHSDAAEKLLERVKKYAVQMKKKYGAEKTYITHPANWFRGEGYNSESLAGCPSDRDAVKYTDPASVYESPEYQASRRSA